MPVGLVGLAPVGLVPAEVGAVGPVVPAVVVVVAHEVVVEEAVVLTVLVVGVVFADNSFPYGKSLLFGLEGVSVEC